MGVPLSFPGAYLPLRLVCFAFSHGHVADDKVVRGPAGRRLLAVGESGSCWHMLYNRRESVLLCPSLSFRTGRLLFGLDGKDIGGLPRLSIHFALCTPAVEKKLALKRKNSRKTRTCQAKADPERFAEQRALYALF